MEVSDIFDDKFNDMTIPYNCTNDHTLTVCDISGLKI